MASIRAGRYTVREILRQADFDFAAKAAVDYLNGGADFRRVKIGGLGFDDLDTEMVIPVTADQLEIRLDGAVDVSLDVRLDAEQEAERARSFESAAEASDTR